MSSINDAVIDGVLCFISSARQSYTEAALTSLCLSFYSSEKITAAKKVLFSLSNEPTVTRKGNGKARSDLTDILTLFNKNEQSGVHLPKFLADSFDAMPPVSGYEILAEHIVDLLEQVGDLKEKIKTLNEAAVALKSTDAIDIREELHDIKTILTSRPPPALKTLGVSAARESTYSSVVSARSALPKATTQLGGKREEAAAVRSFIPIPSATSEHLPINSAVREKRNGNEERFVSDTSVLENSEWQLVNGRRKKKDTIRGVKKISGAVKGVRKTMDVYVGRLDSSVTCDDLKSYINDEISVNMISCICLSSADAQVKSFKVTVYAEDRDILLNENLWPENVFVRKYFSSKNNGRINN